MKLSKYIITLTIFVYQSLGGRLFESSTYLQSIKSKKSNLHGKGKTFSVWTETCS